MCCRGITKHETVQEIKLDKMTQINIHSGYEEKQDDPGYRCVTWVTVDSVHSEKDALTESALLPKEEYISEVYYSKHDKSHDDVENDEEKKINSRRKCFSSRLMEPLCQVEKT